MRGLGSLFIAVCMALIAASAGAVAHFGVGLAPLESALIALALLFALTSYQVFALRRRDRADALERYEDLARTATHIAREVGELGRRVGALESAAAADLRSLTEPLAREVSELGRQVQEIADAMAERKEKPAAPATAQAASGPLPGHTEQETEQLVRDAIEAGRIELYLQPVVTLPQRKVRFYEALARLKLADDAVIEPDRFLPAARKLGLLARIDLRMLRNCVQVVRRLAAKNREVGLFANLAPETFADGTAFGDILALLEPNRALASSIMFDVPQAAFRSFGPLEQQRLAALAERGFHFALDQVEDLKVHPRALAERGVRVLKVPVEMMLQRNRGVGAPIHPVDLADVLARQGIDLIVVGIESEGTVVDLLDYDVRYAQGFLFAPPRPVRNEVLRGELTEPRDAGPALTEAAAAGPRA
jgi:cyclic-di-GMP phosphodiesterase TipF (flagellum assembly factor)